MHIPEPAALRDSATIINGDGFEPGVQPLALDFESRLLAIEKSSVTNREDGEKPWAVGDAMGLGHPGRPIVLEYDYESGLAYPRWTAGNPEAALGAWELRLAKVFDNVHAFLVYQDGPVVWFTPHWRHASLNLLHPVSPTGLVHLLSALEVKPA